VGDGGYGVCGGGGGRDLGEGKTDDEIGSEFSARLSCAIKVDMRLLHQSTSDTAPLTN
jgi:hypothetical protein